MAKPITWQNVGINSGAEAAALGNSAAAFGRTAIMGLDIFGDQMNRRVEREDTRLTNEAIAAALSGGPQVSENRRVDANLLQQAVERQQVGRRAQEAHVSDLKTAGIQQEGMGYTNLMNKFKVEHQEEDYQLQQQLDKALLADRQNSTNLTKLRIEELQDAIAKRQQVDTGVRAVEQELYGEDNLKRWGEEFEADWAGGGGLESGATPEQKEERKQQYLEAKREAQFADPVALHKLATKHGLTVDQLLTNSDVGKRFSAARAANDAAEAELQTLAQQRTQASQKAASEYDAGDISRVKFNGSDYVFSGGGTKINDDAADVILRELGLDPDDEDVQEMESKIRQRFSDASMFEHLARELVGDTERVPGNYGARLDQRAQDIRERARQVQAGPEVPIGYGNPARDLQRSIEAIASKNRPPTQKEEQAVADDLQANPIASAEAISGLNPRPATADEQKVVQASLDLAVEGLNEAAKSVTVPDDASEAIKLLHRRFENSLRIANGGKVAKIPQGGLGRAVIGPRVEVPSFTDRRDRAAEAVKLMQELQLAIATEAENNRLNELASGLH